MLSDARIRELFKEYLPTDPLIGIMSLDAEAYIAQARNHPYIRAQIQMGIYSENNLAGDFLSPARAHPEIGLQVICPDIFNNLLDGIPTDTAEDYVRAVAAHEAHHFHAMRGPETADEHAANEAECVAAVEASHPELAQATAYVEANSPVFQRVYGRMALLVHNHTKKGITL